MQLKRDTDYALRILHCLKDPIEGAPKERRGLTQSEIAAQAKIPRATVGRICDCLCESEMICFARDGENDAKLYSLTDGLNRKTLLDVVEAVEGTGKLFAVFDRKTPMYRGGEAVFDSVQAGCEGLLAAVSLGDLL